MSEDCRHSDDDPLQDRHAEWHARQAIWLSYQQIIFRASEIPDYSSFAILTAFNPESIVLSCKENRQRQQRLEAELSALGYAYLRLDCSAPDGRWHEPSLAVCTGLSQACELAAKWRQNAIYWVSQQQLFLVPVMLKHQGFSQTELGKWPAYLHIQGLE
ncbi:DUF3293 domain-containing protein [Photobacterium sp. 2_MG-2023]|uniref:DUF3293 domain-containing protein n=1 Tax=Photobacterium sp. 2_MG-2023 TaxID=3062663 RepID=UPI0026E1143B|nr:DUF3293 domain-containing protein [Photobacterium sp. 2_MG-2023]MDO6580353.1 DUF3293 domain-containing protein [Photobacterium sp. 2_MG-2023]